MDEKHIDFMRQDLESGFALSKIIDKAKKIIKAEGKDFNQELAKWKETK
ncbi:MAG: hypothetical protein ACREBJ_08165 [Nitrosotalea sp.]